MLTLDCPMSDTLAFLLILLQPSFCE